MLSSNDNGFTLLELLIAMTLTVVLVVIMSLALRSAMRAWSLGKERNQKRVSIEAVLNLMSSELSSAVRPGEHRFFLFHGERDTIRFTTWKVPHGSHGGGIFLVFYRYSPAAKALIYGQKFVAVSGDMLATPPYQAMDEDREELERRGWEVEIISPFPEVTFYFANKEDMELDPGEWMTRWTKDRHSIPEVVAVRIKDEGSGTTWRRFFTSRVVLP